MQRLVSRGARGRRCSSRSIPIALKSDIFDKQKWQEEPTERRERQTGAAAMLQTKEAQGKVFLDSHAINVQISDTAKPRQDDVAKDVGQQRDACYGEQCHIWHGAANGQDNRDHDTGQWL